MRQTRIALLIFLGLQSVTGLQAAEAVRVSVGDGLVSGKVLKPYKNLWRLSVTTSSGKHNPDAGTWSDELRRVNVGGKNCFERIQVANFLKDGKVIATTETRNIFDPRTMAPVSRSFSKHMVAGADESTRIEFHQASVQVEETNNATSTKRDVEIGTPVYDFYGGLYGLLLVAFPLKQGFSATFPSLDEFTPTVSWTTFSVAGREDALAGKKGRVSAWVVESDTNLGPMKFWLSEDAPYIIRLEYVDHDSGTTWTYEMM